MNDLNELTNKGILELNTETNNSGEKTFIVLGAPRGGTSMVAGTLHHLGVNMLPIANIASYERREFGLAIEENRIDEMNSIINNLNNEFKLWGWKRPSSILHLEKWEGKFRNPRYIVVFRDLFAIANRNRISMVHDVIHNMQVTNEHYRLITDFLSKTKEPTLLVSYEKAMADKEHFLEKISKFIGATYSKSVIEKTLNFITTDSPQYLEQSRITHTEGYLDEVSTNHLKGWAFYPAYAVMPIKVKIEVNSEDTFFSIANEFRGDVKDAGLHPTGICGFNFTFPINYRLKTGDVISVRGEGDIKDLINSPFYFGID